MISEIIESLIILWAGKDSSYPTEETTNQNIKLLRNEPWFQRLFSEHTKLFLENRDLRYIIGAAKVQTIIDNPKKKQRFEEDLIHLINLIRK
ncbi:hypothetical protein [Cytobacillus praedii]|uniref:hypothetical protein n=1 Tax=Cytobacillus praedii TaxID=1742358 RepID=UPI00070A6F90|nr:hypothetical protein [Cytobacillus praedii]